MKEQISGTVSTTYSTTKKRSCGCEGLHVPGCMLGCRINGAVRLRVHLETARGFLIDRIDRNKVGYHHIIFGEGKPYKIKEELAFVGEAGSQYFN
jgi:hypothetical protein